MTVDPLDPTKTREEIQVSRDTAQAKRDVEQAERDVTQVERDVTQVVDEAARSTRDSKLDSTVRGLVDELRKGRGQLHRTSREYYTRRRQDHFKVMALGAILMAIIAMGTLQYGWNETQITILKSATNVNGKIYQRGQAQTACAVLRIIKDNRAIHSDSGIASTTDDLSCSPIPVAVQHESPSSPPLYVGGVLEIVVLVIMVFTLRHDSDETADGDEEKNPDES